MSVHQSDEWFVSGLEKLKESYGFKTDVEIAAFLKVARPSLSAIRKGTEKPSARAKFIMADKLGYLLTIEGIRKFSSLTMGEEIAEILEKRILDLVKKPGNESK